MEAVGLREVLCFLLLTGKINVAHLIVRRICVENVAGKRRAVPLTPGIGLLTEIEGCPSLSIMRALRPTFISRTQSKAKFAK
jgi:hypothetical protein